jgi:hypothetical protein
MQTQTQTQTQTLKEILLVFILFLLIFLGWFIVGSIGFYKAIASKNWPTTLGTVVSSEVVRPSGKNTKYEAKVVFTYSVDGKEYTSKKLKATAARGTSDWSRSMVSEFPAGTVVKVHYNPKKPNIALILPGLQKDNFWMTLLPLMVILLILKVMIDQIKKAKNAPNWRKRPLVPFNLFSKHPLAQAKNNK